MSNKTVLAVDLGAESGRVMAVHCNGRSLQLEELHRFPNTTVTINVALHWNFLRLWNDIQTGIQFMPINTLYQLLSLVESDSPQLQIAATFLTAPDLLNYWLTGAKVCEFSNATTTQLFNPTTGAWATEMMDKLGIPSYIFPEIVLSGTQLGVYEEIPVIAPACHDTGSAVAAVSTTTKEFAYISSGTWSLVGLEIDKPILTPEALAANVTNEGGVYGTYRLLKNVIGLWILQQCRVTWAAGQTYSYGELVQMAAQAELLTAVFNPNDPAFLVDHALWH